MNIQAVFFDIDGTLVPFGWDHLPASTRTALDALRAKGIKVIIATGRPPNSIHHMDAMYTFDGYLCANGQYCYDHEGVIHEEYLPVSSLEKLIPYTHEKKIPVLYATLEKSYRNIYNHEDYDLHWPLLPDDDFLLRQKIIQLMAYIDEKDDEEFLTHLPGAKSARWTDRFADIIPVNGGKDQGIDAMIAHYHIPLTNVMVFGDGGNDLSMIKHVPYGIAMGNASDIVKASAYYVTADVEKDGIYQALKHFQVI